jgi:hypothetical protein
MAAYGPGRPSMGIVGSKRRELHGDSIAPLFLRVLSVSSGVVRL